MQPFGNAFDVQFLDSDGQRKPVWATSWGVSTRMIGALIISVVANGLRILSVAQEWQTVVTGVIIILAVYIDILRRRRL